MAASRRGAAVARRERRLRDFYAQFVGPGDLVYDVGANVGERTATLRALGATVVAIEPQATLVERLRRAFAEDPEVHVEPRGLASAPGTAVIHVNASRVLSTMSPDWMEAVERSGRFGEHSRWTGTETVETTTLDELVTRYGVPSFCKIDVEGYELEVLGGLSSPLRLVSLEFAGEFVDTTIRCTERLEELGAYEFSVSEGESLALGPWRAGDAIRSQLGALAGTLAWGDLYARTRART